MKIHTWSDMLTVKVLKSEPKPEQELWYVSYVDSILISSNESIDSIMLKRLHFRFYYSFSFQDWFFISIGQLAKVTKTV